MSELDGPFNDVVMQAAKIIDENTMVLQKFTCSGCGARLTLEPPNVFFRSATCDECGALTNIEAQGCGFTVLIMGNPHAAAKVRSIFDRRLAARGGEREN